MEIRDPTGDTEPDFHSNSWEIPRNAIVEGGKTVDEAVEILRKGWQAQHEKNLAAWNGHLEQQQRDLEGQRGNGEAPRTVDPANENFDDDETPDWLNKPTPSFLDIRPARHVLKRLEKREFVELWHFTAQGCLDASATDLKAPDDTFSIVNTDQGLMLQSFGASSVSPKLIRDEELSWEQLTEGKTRLVECMGSHGWSEHEVKALARFYMNLDISPIRSQQYGTQAILRYQELVRRDWTISLKSGEPYAIDRINYDLLRDCQRQIGMEILARNNVSPKSKPPNKQVLTIPFHTFQTPTQ